MADNNILNFNSINIGAWDTGNSHSMRKNGARSNTAHKTSIHIPNHPSSPSHKTLLKKRFSFGSIPTTANISTSSTKSSRLRSNVVHSSSPSNTRRCYRKIRKGYTSAKTSPNNFSLSQGTSRRSSVIVSGSCRGVKRSTSSHCGKLSADFTLPRVGQRSKERDSDEISCGWTTKSRKQNHTHFEKKIISQRRVDDLKITNTRLCGVNDVRLHHKPLKKSSSIGAGVGGVAKMWGHVGMKRWGDGESCFEDEEWEGEESGTSTLGDPISIEGIYCTCIHYSVHLTQLNVSDFNMNYFCNR